MEIHGSILSSISDESITDFINKLIRLAYKLSHYKYSHLAYFAPEIVEILTTRLQNPANLLEKARAELSQEQCEDLEESIASAYEAIRDIYTPTDSFFFTYKDGEYFSLVVDGGGELVEDYKYGQSVDDARKFDSLKIWCQEYGLELGALEIAVCVDFCEEY